MEITLYQQATSFLLSVFPGAIIAIIYIVLSVIREISPPGNIQLIIGDILFMCTAAVINFVFSLSQSSGAIRLYSIFVEIAVFLIIYFTLGRLIKHVIGYVFSILCRLFRLVLNPAALIMGDIRTAFIEKRRKMVINAKKRKK